MEKQTVSDIPLAERMRPRQLADFVGQEHILGRGKLLCRILENRTIHSIIFWGPPGSGKTTLAHIVADVIDAFFVPLSAVTSGIKDVRQVIAEAAENRKTHAKPTILLIDEIHRFNKAQQDAFLPHVEHGDIVLIGATTENPSFEVVSPLLSRIKVLVLHPLSADHINGILTRALTDKLRGLGALNIRLADDARRCIVEYCQGDARVALNTLELAVSASLPLKKGQVELSKAVVEEALQKKVLLYDKQGEAHFNIISALHKSMRSSDVNASLYWLVRMLEAGEDPLYIVRRLVRFASEDVGMADPRALQVALSAKDAFHFIGLPEGKLAIAQAVIYLASAPKSNAVYRAYSRAQETVAGTGSLPVPLHIRNAPTTLMKHLGYGKGYQYDHDCADGISSQECLPEEIKGSTFYVPTERGFEKTVAERMQYVEKKKASAQRQKE